MGYVDDSAWRIELTVPMRAEFVSIVRLAVAGVANRAGFDIDDIEDIKVALSEVCNKLISGNSRRASPDEETPGYRVEYVISDDGLTINVYTDSVSGDVFRASADGVSPVGDQSEDFMSGVGAVADQTEDFMSGVGDEDYYSDQIWFSLIQSLMDDFVINANGQCLVTMKKDLN